MPDPEREQSPAPAQPQRQDPRGVTPPQRPTNRPMLSFDPVAPSLRGNPVVAQLVQQAANVAALDPVVDRTLRANDMRVVVVGVTQERLEAEIRRARPNFPQAQLSQALGFSFTSPTNPKDEIVMISEKQFPPTKGLVDPADVQAKTGQFIGTLQHEIHHIALAKTGEDRKLSDSAIEARVTQSAVPGLRAIRDGLAKSPDPGVRNVAFEINRIIIRDVGTSGELAKRK